MENDTASWMASLPGFLRARLMGRPVLHKIVSNIGWLFIDRLIRLALGLVVGVWVARYLGPGQFGILNFSVAFVALFASVATLGIDVIAVRDIVRDPAAKDEILGTTFILRFLAGLAVFCATVAAISLLRPDDGLTRWFVGITAAGIIFNAFDTIELWFQSQVKSKFAVLARNAAYLCVAGVKVALILLAAPLLAFAWAGLAEIVLGALGLCLVYRIYGSHFSAWRPSLARARTLLHDCWPLLVSTVAITLYMRINQVMLGQMAGNEEVGIFSVALRLVEIWYFIPMIVLPSVYPSIVEAKEISEELFYNRLQKYYNLMAFVAYALSLAVSIGAVPIVQLLFGQVYQRAAPMLAVLIWSMVFTNLGVARGAFLTAMNWNRFYLLTTCLGCVVNLVLNYFLIPLYGGMGAVIAAFISYWMAAHGACFLFKPLHKTGLMLTRAMIYPKFW